MKCDVPVFKTVYSKHSLIQTSSFGLTVYDLCISRNQGYLPISQQFWQRNQVFLDQIPYGPWNRPQDWQIMISRKQIIDFIVKYYFLENPTKFFVISRKCPFSRKGSNMSYICPYFEHVKAVTMIFLKIIKYQLSIFGLFSCFYMVIFGIKSTYKDPPLCQETC